jgi:MATE family multidrug resistance protein
MSSSTTEAQLQPSTRKPGGVAELLAIALPMVISQACETLMMFTDRLMLARLGPEHMSAAMGGGLACFLFMTFFMGLTGYATALVAQHLGAGKEKSCALAGMQGVWISLAAWPVIILCMPLGLLLFHSSSIAPEQLELQETYFMWLLYGAGIGLLRNSLASFFSGVGRTKVVMVSAMVALVVNVACNYLLIFGKLGFPAMGIRGAAIGTILGGLFALLVLICSYFAPAIRDRFGVREGFFAWTGS